MKTKKKTAAKAAKSAARADGAAKAKTVRRPKYTLSPEARQQRRAAGKRSAVTRRAEDRWLTCAVGAKNKAWAVAAYGSVNEALTALRKTKTGKEA